MPIALMASRCPLGIALIERHEMAEQMGSGYAGEGAEGCWGAKVRVVGARQKGSGWADGYRGEGWSGVGAQGGGGGATQSINVGNNCGTSRPPFFFGFYRFQKLPMYGHRSNFRLIFQGCSPQKVDKVVDCPKHCSMEYRWKPLLSIQLFYSIISLQPSKMSYHILYF